MYINHNKIIKSQLLPFDVMLFTVLYYRTDKDPKYDFVLHYINMDKDRVNQLVNLEYLTLIKGTKKQKNYEKLRLSAKGKKMFKDICEASVGDNHLILRDWVVKTYRGLDKKTHNQKRLAWLIAQFEATSGITGNKLARLIQHFMSDESNMKYNNVSDYLFINPDTRYIGIYSLEDSRLHQYYMHRKEYFDNLFKNIKK